MTSHTGSRTRARLPRAAGLATVAVGLALVVAAPAMSLFSGATAGERILHRFDGTFSHAGLVKLTTGFSIAGGLSDQFFGSTLPELRRQLGMSPQAFDAYLSRTYPAVAAGRHDIPPAVKFVAPAIPQITGAHNDFESAKTLPGLGLPPSSAPWLMIGAGAALVLLGIAALRRPGRAAMAAIALAGAALVVVPLALSMPAKARAGTHLGDVGRITLSQEAATTALRTTNETDAIVKEVEQRMIPSLAARAHTTPAAYAAQLGRAYPAVARGLAAWPVLRPQSYALVANMQASLADYKRVDAVPVDALPWIVIGPGIALMVLAGLALPRQSLGRSSVKLSALEGKA